jgi:hypothetical protein
MLSLALAHQLKHRFSFFANETTEAQRTRTNLSDPESPIVLDYSSPLLTSSSDIIIGRPLFMPVDEEEAMDLDEENSRLLFSSADNHDHEQMDLMTESNLFQINAMLHTLKKYLISPPSLFIALSIIRIMPLIFQTIIFDTTLPIILVLASTIQYVPVCAMTLQIVFYRQIRNYAYFMPVTTRFNLFLGIFLLFIWQIEISIINRIFLNLFILDNSKATESILCIVPPWLHFLIF